MYAVLPGGLGDLRSGPDARARASAHIMTLTSSHAPADIPRTHFAQLHPYHPHPHPHPTTTYSCLICIHPLLPVYKIRIHDTRPHPHLLVHCLRLRSRRTLRSLPLTAAHQTSRFCPHVQPYTHPSTVHHCLHTFISSHLTSVVAASVPSPVSPARKVLSRPCLLRRSRSPIYMLSLLVVTYADITYSFSYVCAPVPFSALPCQTGPASVPSFLLVRRSCST